MQPSPSPGPLTRGGLLRRGLALGAGASAAPWLLDPARALARDAAVGGTLEFLSWQGYDSPKSLKPWLKAAGVKLKPTYIASHDDIQAKILALHGGKGYDIITYYQGYKDLYHTLKILQPMDEAKIPNLKGLIPFFGSKEHNYWVDPNGQRTGVPMYWGALGLTYDSKAMKTPTTYDVLFDKKYKGKVTLTDDPVGAFTQAGHIVGVDVSRMTPAQFDKVAAYLKAIIKQTRGVAPSYGEVANRLASGEAVVAFLGWAAMDVFAAAAGNKNIRTVLPKEGGYAYCDSWAIPISCDNVDTAHAWINNAISPAVSAKAAKEQGGGGVTPAGSIKLLDPATRALYPYSKLSAFFAKAPLYGNPPVRSDRYVTIDKVIAKWQNLKASA